MSFDRFESFKSDVPTAVNSLDDSYVALRYSRDGLPTGWTMYIHPRGWVYFRNIEYAVVTDEDVRVPDILNRVMKQCARKDFCNLPDGVEICLLSSADSSFHLLIDHNQCTAKYGVEPTTEIDDSQNASMTTILRRRRLYWNFVQQHPTHVPSSQRALAEAVDAIKSFYWDNLVEGPRSIVPFSKAECEDLLRILAAPQGASVDDNLVSTTMLVAWILREVYSFRHAERHGRFTYPQFKTYQQSLRHPPYVPPTSSRLSQILLSILVNGPFFGIPQTYLEHVRKASEFPGRLSGLGQNWEKYTQQLTQEYSDFILVSTVLLSATVGMLSIGDIYQMARVLSILSAFASLGSITISVFFVWRHQRNTDVPTSHTFAYIHNSRNHIMGLTGHSLLLSLPAVLLVWSLIGFTSAMMAYTLQTVTGVNISDGASTWVLLGVFAVVSSCVLASVYTFSVMWKWDSELPLKRYLRNLFRRSR